MSDGLHLLRNQGKKENDHPSSPKNSKLPVWTWVRLSAFTAVSFVVVLASGHFFSILASYSQLRKIAHGFMHYGR